MTGNADAAYDHELQEKAAPKVVETWDAVTGSRKHTSALGSAQTSTFWGHEEGPTAIRIRSADMFDAVSELLNRETAMLKDFEEKMHAAMTRFTGTEYENALGFKETQADMEAQSIRSKEQDEYTALLHKIGLTLEDIIHLPVGSGTSTTGPQSSSGGAGAPSGSGPATGTAMDRWVDASVQRITKYREAYERGFRSYSNGRGVMATALAEGEKISADLIDAETEAMRDDWVVSVPDSEPGPGIRAMGKLYTTGAAYVEAVEAQANAQREAAAERILTMLNSSTKAISVEMEGRPNSAEPGKGLEDYEEEEHQKENNAGSGGGNRSDSHTAGRGASGWGYSRDDDFGRAADRSSASGNYPGGFDQPWWSEADAAAARSRIVSSGAVETCGAQSAWARVASASPVRLPGCPVPVAWVPRACVVSPVRPMAWVARVSPPSRLVPTPVPVSAPTLPLQVLRGPWV